MKEKSLRRHQDFNARKKQQQTYNSCLPDLSQSERYELENNIKKLRRACIISHFDEHSNTATKKTLQEMKHDISMKEQLKRI